MENFFWFFWLLIYALGIFLSQSLLAVGGTLGIAALIFRRDFPSFAWRSPAVWGLAWILVSVVNLLWRMPVEHLSESLRALPLVLLPLLAWQRGPGLLQTLRKHPALVRALVGLVSLLVFAAFARSAYQALWMKRPATGLMSNQIYFAYAMLPFFLFGAELSFVSGVEQKIRRRFAILTVLVAICLILSHTRMAWVVVALWTLFRGLPILWRRPSKQFFWSVLFGGVALLVFLFLYQPDFQNKVGRIFEAGDPSKLSRSFIWKFNAKLLADHPWLGVGFEQNGVIPLDTEVRELFMRAGLNPDFRIYAHNVFLQAAVDNGILGLVLWLGYWIALAWRRRYTSIYFIFMGVAGLTENFLNNSRAAHSFYVFALLFLLLDFFRVEEERHGAGSQSPRNA